MADDNKPMKYMRYAIGEVVLVVIGILIALSINNWNEARKERLEEMVILKQLQTEFISNLTQLDQKIASKKDLMNSAMQLFHYIDYPNLLDKDSIDFHLARTLPYSTFDPIVNDLASSGSLRIITNNRLKQILSFWTSEIADVREDELNWKYYRNEIYIPFLIEHYQLRTIRSKATKLNVLGKYAIELDNEASDMSYDIGLSKHTEDFISLLNHPDMEDHMERALAINKFATSQSLSLRRRIVEIIDLLHAELTKG